MLHAKYKDKLNISTEYKLEENLPYLRTSSADQRFANAS